MTKNKKGFTIIEVVLVLAIAGLIFLMVFIALPALQRSQRNTQREDDISRFLTAANDYQTNNNGKTPFGSGDHYHAGVKDTFVTRYIDKNCSTATEEDGSYTGCGSEFTDPDGEIYHMVHRDGWSGKATGESAAKGVVSVVSSEPNAVWPNNHTVEAFTYATCGDEGEFNKGSGEREYALFYVLEGGSITCNDNH